MIDSKSKCALRTAAVMSFFASSFVLATPALANAKPQPAPAVDAIIGTGKDASTNAIIGTGKDASTNAIIGTGKDASTSAIIGTGKTASTNAIIGTGKDASTSAIIGTGKDASTSAIVGTGKTASTNAIIGTGKDASTSAIIGTGRTASTDAIIGTGKDASTSAIVGTGRVRERNVALAGPIEALDANLGTFAVQSRTLRVPGDRSVLIRLAAELGAGRVPQAIVISTIGVRGELEKPVVLFVGEQYVPGSSEVVVSGRVTSIDASRGLATIGSSTFDYTSVLSTDKVELEVGSIVRVRGTQPQAGQPIIAWHVAEISR